MKPINRLLVLALLLTRFLHSAIATETDFPKILWVQYGLANHTLKLAVHTDADPLKPTEASATLQFKNGDTWKSVSAVRIDPVTTVAEFRIEHWNTSQSRAYRVLCGSSELEGIIQADPIKQNVLKLMAISCVNDKKFPYRKTVEQMVSQNPDIVFFAGDQLYQTNSGGETLEAETEEEVLPAMASYLKKWRKFGLTFRDLLKDRPSIIITDDHDVFARDLWGNGGKRMTGDRTMGGYLHPTWVNAVERIQMFCLPDPAIPGPWGDGIYAYFTSLEYGGVSFAILEDRKFKSPPTDILKKAIDNPNSNKPNTTLEVIMDPTFDTSTLDAPGLNLLGEAQENFVSTWADKVSKTDRLAAVLHQSPLVNVGNYQRTFGDMDSNGWPQTGRKAALAAIRRAWAPHICGDQHLAVLVKHGISAPSDGPFGFTVPAIVNTIYGRWWQPQPQKAGANPIPDSPLPWTGEFTDGLGNRIRMLAYANPPDRTDERQRGDGYGIVRFNKTKRTVTVECWPRFADVRQGDKVQFPGWPVSFDMKDNDGRKPTGWLPELQFPKADSGVVQVIDEKTGEVLYTVRTASNRFRPPVYSPGPFTLKAGPDRPNEYRIKSLRPSQEDDKTTLTLKF